ncbi:MULTISPECIES: MATE family efflux transporter [unclassified Luteococcus]|uniref:MATE family efflux transporter n=1 Tax=unclassified Luteococcus TaxID=2639923 RepID=UPI00313C0140
MRRVFALAIPISLQSLLMAMLSLTDQLMVGQLGSSAVAATGIGAQLGMLVTVVVTTLGTAFSAYAAQYHATGRTEQFKGTVLLAAAAALTLALPVALVGSLNPQAAMSPFTHDAQLIDVSSPFIRCLTLSLLPAALTIVCTAALRSMGHVRLPLYASLAAIAVNLGLDWVLIFGQFGAPRLGLLGAGIGTLSARLLELGLVIASLVRLVGGHAGWTLLPRRTSCAIAGTAVPQVATELLWVLSENTYTGVYGRIGTQSLAAMALTYPLQSMIFGLTGGLAAAAIPILGEHLGHQRRDAALADARLLLRMGMGGAILIGAGLFALAPHYVGLYSVDGATAMQATAVLRILAFYLVVKVSNQVISGGILPAGGDSRFQLLSESLATWLVGVPLALASAFLLHLPLPWVYGLLSLEEVARFVIVRHRVGSGKWMRISA